MLKPLKADYLFAAGRMTAFSQLARPTRPADADALELAARACRECAALAPEAAAPAGPTAAPAACCLCGTPGTHVGTQDGVELWMCLGRCPRKGMRLCREIFEGGPPPRDAPGPRVRRGLARPPQDSPPGLATRI